MTKEIREETISGRAPEVLMGSKAESSSPGRVLVVDDDDDLLEILGILLTSHGFEVSLADGGSKALEIARDEDLDVIVLDVMMPRMDGFEVCRELKKVPSAASVPVIMLTARDDLEARAQGMYGAVSEFLPKPFDEDLLVSRIRTQVAARRHERALRELQERAASLGSRRSE
jgi:DNA-binding response OmpR family regulator